MIFVNENSKNKYSVVFRRKDVKLFDILLNNLVNNCDKDFIESKLSLEEKRLLENLLEWVEYSNE